VVFGIRFGGADTTSMAFTKATEPFNGENESFMVLLWVVIRYSLITGDGGIAGNENPWRRTTESALTEKVAEERL
jgi:hypothetical protein